MSLKNQLSFTWASYVILFFWGMGGGGEGNDTGYNRKAIGMPKFHQDIAA